MLRQRHPSTVCGDPRKFLLNMLCKKTHAVSRTPSKARRRALLRRTEFSDYFPFGKTLCALISFSVFVYFWTKCIVLNIPTAKLEGAGESITSIDNVAEFREEPMFEAIRMEHDICIEMKEEDICKPMQCQDESESFYHGLIVRPEESTRPNVVWTSPCIISMEYKFVFINVLRDTLSNIIGDALMAGSHQSRLLSQTECDATILNDGEYFVFTFVRDPYARLVANWYSMKQSLEQKMESKLRAFENGHGHGQSVMSGEEKLESLRDLINNPLAVEYATFDSNRMKPQSGSILDQHKCPMIDFVGKWESAKQDFERIMQHIHDKYKAFPREECVKEMHSLEDDPREQSWIHLLINDSQTQDLIHEKYADDFEYFGYSKYV